MKQQRFKANTSGSFFGEFLYEQVIPADHFLLQLKRIVPWQQFSQKLVQYYEGHALLGRPPYDPAVILKMLLLSYLYDLSERQTEEHCNLYLPAKCFLGLGVDERPPDHTTLTAFKERILKNGNLAAFEGLLRDIIALARQKGVSFGRLQVVDSTHTVANVNVQKDERRQSKGQGPRDSGASWGVKRSYRVKGEDGRERPEKQYFYGYKAHASLNAHSGMITSLCHSSGNRPDNEHFCGLVQADLAQGLPVAGYSADRGYDDSDLHVFLESQGLQDALKLNRSRTTKKDPNKQVWLELQESQFYQEGLKERYKIERKFGEAKQEHGLRRCRYVGLARYAIQSFLTAMALNLKRLVLLLTGVPFKGRARALA